MVGFIDAPVPNGEAEYWAKANFMWRDGEEASLMEITLPKNYPLEGKPLSQLSIPNNCNIACISRGGRTIIPRGNTVLLSGDTLLTVMMNSAEKELRKTLKIKD